MDDDYQRLIERKMIETYQEIMADALRHPAMQSVTLETAAVISSPQFAAAFIDALQGWQASPQRQAEIEFYEKRAPF